MECSRYFVYIILLLLFLYLLRFMYLRRRIRQQLASLSSLQTRNCSLAPYFSQLTAMAGNSNTARHGVGNQVVNAGLHGSEAPPPHYDELAKEEPPPEYNSCNKGFGQIVIDIDTGIGSTTASKKFKL